MFRLFCATALLLAAVLPAAAAEQDQTQRGFSLTNHTGQTIEHAEITTTLGKTQKVSTYGPIQPAQSTKFRMDAGQCVAAVQVRLKGGKVIRADKLNDCRFPRLVATAQGISAQTAAR